MQINRDLLKKTCQNTIEAILWCLDPATLGTIYLIGPMPRLRAERITSGIKGDGPIRWGLPQVSDYNPPGKQWEEYRDTPGRPLEAMGWCVQHQKSWTADNPQEDARSVRKQLRGEIEDSYHMEPVLVRKADLSHTGAALHDYPLDAAGSPIWQGSRYFVAAVIKIHFLPHSIHRGDRFTRIIKRLSSSLGTELLSLHLRESCLQAREILVRERLEATNAISHEVRNTLAQMGLVFSSINTLMSFLRDQWEIELHKAHPSLENKRSLLGRLTELLRLGRARLNGDKDLRQLSRQLVADQEELRSLSLLPQQEETWLHQKIKPKWEILLASTDAWDDHEEEITDLLDRLERAFWLVLDEGLAETIAHLPPELKTTWPEIAYTRFSADNRAALARVLAFLDHPGLNIQNKQQVRKALGSMKMVVDTIASVEDRTNRVLLALQHGGAGAQAGTAA